MRQSHPGAITSVNEGFNSISAYHIKRPCGRKMNKLCWSVMHAIIKSMRLWHICHTSVRKEPFSVTADFGFCYGGNIFETSFERCNCVCWCRCKVNVKFEWVSIPSVKRSDLEGICILSSLRQMWEIRSSSNQREEVRGTQLYRSPRSIILYLSSLGSLGVTVSAACASLSA